MSHEFRTPLNAVIGYSEILLEDADAAGAERGESSDLKRINNAGKHLLSLVTEVLDISKIESDHIDLNVETFDLNALLRDIASTSKPLIERQRQHLRAPGPVRPRPGAHRPDQAQASPSQPPEQRRQVHQQRRHHA